MLPAEALAALDEITFLKKDCLGLIDEALTLCVEDGNGNLPDAFRTVVTPFLYAVWERCFTTSFGVMARLQRSTPPASMDHRQAALWLQAEPFFQSLADKLRNSRPSSGDDAKNAVKAGTYRSLSEFVEKYRDWDKIRPGSHVDTSKLVMTFSNVNCEVLDVNAEAFGLTDLSEYELFRREVGRLEDLLGRRNDISHGTLARPPQDREFRELVAFTREKLISGFCELVQTWIVFRS